MPHPPLSPLSDDLVSRYHAWHADGFQTRKATFERLVSDGQKPPLMVVSCADSRVDPAVIFGAVPGEFFVHRNVANFVPAADAGALGTGTAAALEFAILHLKISGILVLGHSGCGGIAGCHDLALGKADALKAPKSFIGPWVEAITPAFDVCAAHSAERAETLPMMEREGVKLSLSNLMTYSFVQDGVAADTLTLTGGWIDIASGRVEILDRETGSFAPL